MARDLEKELRSWDGDWPPCWRPRENETLIGRVLRYDVAQTSFGPVRTCMLEKEDGSGRISIFLSQEVLRREFERQKPKVGERIGVKFAGKNESKGYRKYVLIVDREEAAPDFAPLGGERDFPADDPRPDADDNLFGDTLPASYARETMATPPAARGTGRPLAIAPREARR